MGIALYDGIQIQIESTWTSQLHHTIELAPAVERALRQVGIGTEDIQAVGVAIGPGSFTSLRTGVAFAKGFALARRIPLVGIPSLDFLAAAQPLLDMPLAAVLEVGRKRLAVGWYEVALVGIEGRPHARRWQPTGEMELLTAKELSARVKQPTYICGELSEEARLAVGRKWKNAILASPAQARRQPAFLAELAWERWEANGGDDPVALSPVYMSLEGQKARIP